MRIDTQTRQHVEVRANHRCEYCDLHKDDEPFLRFHIEHIVARQHGGGSELSNLALACHHCNLHKGPNLSGIDPDTGAVAPLFNPRVDNWRRHFAWRAQSIVGITSAGRATVFVLAMNAVNRVELRMEIARLHK